MRFGPSPTDTPFFALTISWADLQVCANVALLHPPPLPSSRSRAMVMCCGHPFLLACAQHTHSWPSQLCFSECKVRAPKHALDLVHMREEVLRSARHLVCFFFFISISTAGDIGKRCCMVGPRACGSRWRPSTGTLLTRVAHICGAELADDAGIQHHAPGCKRPGGSGAGCEAPRPNCEYNDSQQGVVVIRDVPQAYIVHQCTYIHVYMRMCTAYNQRLSPPNSACDHRWVKTILSCPN
jgi:hypothetical protein